MQIRRSAMAAIGICATAIIAAHELAYRVAAGNAHERAHLLAESGHGWWVLAPYLVGVGLALVAIVTATSKSVDRLRWWLSPAAAVFYAAIETGERLIGGAHHHGPVHLPTLLTGSAISLIFGLIAACLLRTGERFVAALRGRRRNSPSRVEHRSAAAKTLVPSFRLVNPSDRGPPAFLNVQPAA